VRVTAESVVENFLPMRLDFPLDVERVSIPVLIVVRSEQCEPRFSSAEKLLEHFGHENAGEFFSKLI